MEFDPSRITFIVVSAIAVVSAFRVVTAPKIMHAALWLGLTFLMLAGVFLVMGAEFLAAAQVLIYVGAITTIILFGIMLSEAAEVRGRGAAPLPVEREERRSFVGDACCPRWPCWRLSASWCSSTGKWLGRRRPRASTTTRSASSVGRCLRLRHSV